MVAMESDPVASILLHALEEGEAEDSLALPERPRKEEAVGFAVPMG
jgi:hypothetical protein